MAGSVAVAATNIQDALAQVEKAKQAEGRYNKAYDNRRQLWCRRRRAFRENLRCRQAW